MAKRGEARERVTFKCSVCGNENYRKSKNKRNKPDPLELNKHCKHCKQTTSHKEKK